MSQKGFVKSPELRSGELKSDFAEIIDGDITNRFLDTESKLFREFEDVYLPQYMKEFGVKTADELKIEAELQTILDPCVMCQKQMDRFREMYKAKITVYSSGSKDGFNLGKMYPKLKVNNPKSK